MAIAECRREFRGQRGSQFRKINALTSFTMSALNTTQVKPLSCKLDNNDGSWKMKTVTTSVAIK